MAPELSRTNYAPSRLRGRDDATPDVRDQLSTDSLEFDDLVAVPRRVTTVKTRVIANLHNTHLLRADTEDATPAARDVEDTIVAKVERHIAARQTVQSVFILLSAKRR